MSDEEQKIIDAVAKGYDVAGDGYFSYYRSAAVPVVNKYTDLFVRALDPDAAIFELGCGNGLPTTAALASKFRVTAVDVSEKQVEKARRNVPNADVFVADMSSVEFGEGEFDGVIALYSIVHLPRNRQPGLLRSIYRWLRPGGLFMATFARTADENYVEDDWFGAPMHWSGWDAESNRRMVADAGFSVESSKLETSDDPNEPGETETHLWIVARKPA